MNNHALLFSDVNVPDFVNRARESLALVNGGRLKRLIINLPPRHLATALAQATLIDFANRYPTGTAIYLTYNEFLARHIKSEVTPYIPETFRLSAGNFDKETPNKAFDLIVIDSPHRDRADGSVPNYQERALKNYNYFVSRLKDGGAIVLFSPRWDRRDLTGRVIAQESAAGVGFMHLAFPIFDADGKELWPGRYKIDDLLQLKADFGPRLWKSAYMQDPID